MSFWKANAIFAWIPIINRRWLFQSACNSYLLLCNKPPQDLVAYNNHFIIVYEPVDQPGSFAVSWRDGGGAGGPGMASVIYWPKWTGETSYVSLSIQQASLGSRCHSFRVLSYPFQVPACATFASVHWAKQITWPHPDCHVERESLSLGGRWVCFGDGYAYRDGMGGIWGQLCGLSYPSSSNKEG